MSKVALYFRRWKNYTRQKSKCSFFPTVECVPVWHTAVNHSLRGSKFLSDSDAVWELVCFYQLFLSTAAVVTKSLNATRKKTAIGNGQRSHHFIIIWNVPLCTVHHTVVRFTWSTNAAMQTVFIHISLPTVYGMRAQSNGQWNAQSEMATNINRNSLRLQTTQRVNKRKKQTLWQFQLQCCLISQKEK